MKKKKIAIIIGSKSDLPQCASGLELLRQQVSQGAAEATIHIISVHRHTDRLLWLLQSLNEAGDVDAIIAGAGKAAHLPGCVDAYLRHRLGDTQIKVIGVAFSGGGGVEGWIDTLTARLSITRVPGTQVLYAGSGSHGFSRACRLAISELPAIKLKVPPPCQDLSLERAIDLATRPD